MQPYCVSWWPLRHSFAELVWSGDPFYLFPSELGCDLLTIAWAWLMGHCHRLPWAGLFPVARGVLVMSTPPDPSRDPSRAMLHGKMNALKVRKCKIERCGVMVKWPKNQAKCAYWYEGNSELFVVRKFGPGKIFRSTTHISGITFIKFYHYYKYYNYEQHRGQDREMWGETTKESVKIVYWYEGDSKLLVVNIGILSPVKYSGTL